MLFLLVNSFSTRYFAEIMLEAGCADWAFLLSLLLLDLDLIGRIMEAFTRTNGCQIDKGVVNRCIQGIMELGKWAESEWYVMSGLIGRVE